MSPKPIFVLVPGNFLPPTYYASTASQLASHGFQTRLVTLPSTGSTSPLTSNEPDVLAVRHVLEELTDAGKETIVVAHSYGSIPTCEAVRGLGCEERGKLGKTGGVVRLVFIAAWLLREGEKPPDIIGRHEMEAPWIRFEGGNLIAHDPIYAFHNDTSAETAAYWAPHTTHSDLAAFATPLQYAAWREIPATYLLCELDKCILSNVQEGMLAATEGRVRGVRLQSGHMPMLSVPERLADVLRGEVGGSEGEGR